MTIEQKAGEKFLEEQRRRMIEYLYKNIQSLLKDYGVSEASADISTRLFLANFERAMKENKYPSLKDLI